MIFDVDSNYAHPRSWLRTQVVEHNHISDNILGILRISTSWNQVLWCLAVSYVIPGHSWCQSKSSHVTWCILKIIDSDDFWWISVLEWGECFAPPTHPQDGCPKYLQMVRSTLLQWTSFRNQGVLWVRTIGNLDLKANRIQMKNSRSFPLWFSTYIPIVSTFCSEPADVEHRPRFC